ncbi:MAG: UbiA family prenyltransferase [Chitinophagales bacterium]|nr:UbiA family prenyltransferase [Chitinophagales bacterium]
MNTLSKLYYYFRLSIFEFVKYRLHLSVIFYSLLLYNNIRLNGDINYFITLSFTLWHFALFLFDRIYDRKLDAVSQSEEYIKDKQANSLYIVFAVCLLTSFILYFFSSANIFYWALLFPITFLYPLRIVNQFRFKNILIIKNLYSALLIYILPLLIQTYIINPDSILNSTTLKPLLSLGLYVWLGEVFWDIRDLSADKTHGVHTIPNTFGITITKVFMVSIILIDAALNNWSFSLSAFIYIVLLTFIKESSDRLFFHLPPIIAMLRFILN